MIVCWFDPKALLPGRFLCLKQIDFHAGRRVLDSCRSGTINKNFRTVFLENCHAATGLRHAVGTRWFHYSTLWYCGMVHLTFETEILTSSKETQCWIAIEKRQMGVFWRKKSNNKGIVYHNVEIQLVLYQMVSPNPIAAVFEKNGPEKESNSKQKHCAAIACNRLRSVGPNKGGGSYRNSSDLEDFCFQLHISITAVSTEKPSKTN